MDGSLTTHNPSREGLKHKHGIEPELPGLESNALPITYHFTLNVIT